MDYDIDNPVNEETFQTSVSGTSYQIVLHEDYPQFWPLQQHLLLAIQRTLHRLPTNGCTVVIPNLVERQSNTNTKTLIRLTRIQNVHQGIQIWIQYLKRNHAKIGIANDDCNFRSIKLSEVSRMPISRMTQVMAKVMQIDSMSDELGNGVAEDLKDEVVSAAEELLCRRIKAMPLDFVLYNFKSLMETAWNSAERTRLMDAAEESTAWMAKMFPTSPEKEVRLVIGRHIGSRRASPSQDMGASSTHWFPWTTKFEASTGYRHVWRSTGGHNDCWKNVEVATNIAPSLMKHDFIRKLLLPSVIEHRAGYWYRYGHSCRLTVHSANFERAIVIRGYNVRNEPSNVLQW